MALREEFERTGQWLFRWRSYVPLVPLAVTVASITGFRYPEGSRELNVAWDVVCLCISMLGLGIRALVVGHAPGGTSGRNTRQGQVANTLNSTGMYSLVRHPLYVGNYLMWLGILLIPRNAWVAVAVSMFYWLYYERIMFAEEEFLRAKFGAPYEEWAARTPAFLPRLRGWITPALPFSWRNVARREYSGLFVITLLFPLMNALANYAAARDPRPDGWQVALLAGGAATYLALRTLKRNTRLLRVEGR
jgi:protein-S-isoprenylcysteine O-methyltransferase Ste14